MREVDWQKVKDTKSSKTPFSIAVGLYLGTMGIAAAAAITVRAYDSQPMQEQRALATIDADKSTPNSIDLQPMP